MAAEEACLRLALIGQMGNASHDTSGPDVLRFIVGYTGVPEAELAVKPFHLNSFLVQCCTQATRDRVLAASPVPLVSSSLSLRPWTRLVNAEPATSFNKVVIEVDGIPAHAWDLDAASKLLAPQCLIERLDDATSTKADLSTFKVTA